MYFKDIIRQELIKSSSVIPNLKLGLELKKYSPIDQKNESNTPG